MGDCSGRILLLIGAWVNSFAPWSPLSYQDRIISPLVEKQMVISYLQYLQIDISLELGWLSVRKNVRWAREGLNTG